ncbi:oxysterol-binding protein 1-like isoform X3 [Narcine bancroftii]|uniref:oxysterol-binding protein 1-like isoform X3 n=1 Tax=Narcine bancroftii TaxID=1343680 RepID=UPI003831CD61
MAGGAKPGGNMADAKAPADTYKGWLFKWTNYLKGYQRRWFVLSNGLLSYYRTQAEMGHTCRGTINLATANITVEDSCSFVISNGGAQTYHLKATSEVERQRWVTALELAKAKAVRMQAESDDSADEEPAPTHGEKTELQGALRALGAKVEDLSTCNDLIAKHGAALQRSLAELEGLRPPPDGWDKVRQVNERATLFRITSNAMINASRDFLLLAQTHSKRWQRALQQERDRRGRLEETLEQLAKQHNHLERAFRGATVLPHAGPPSAGPAKGGGGSRDLSDEDDDDIEFFDAMEDVPEFITVPADSRSHRRTGSNISGASSEGGFDDQSLEEQASSGASSSHELACQDTVKHRRRRRIPDKPNYSLNLWSIMKNCIGKELSRIPMPVSHHPPSAAHHVESRYGWTLRQQITIASKFRGKYLSIMPLGTIHCTFQQMGDHYTWEKVTTTVHNIIVGKLWIDQSGEVDIVNRRTGDKCHLKFAPYSYFSRDVARKVTGLVTDSAGKAHFVLSGTWDEKMECSRVLQSSHGVNGAEGRQKTVYETLRSRELWRKHQIPEHAETMYYFSDLALTLNEPETGVAPTDSRRRPDQRLMENGRWDEANVEKQRLEEKQRAGRRRRENEGGREGQCTGEGGYLPLWFERQEDPMTKEPVHFYKGGYWEAKERQDWGRCPEIF